MSWTEPLKRTFRRVDVRLGLSLVALYAPLVGAVLLALYVFATDEVLDLLDVRADLRVAELVRVLDQPPGPVREQRLERLGTLLAEEASGFLVLDARGNVLERGGARTRQRGLHSTERSVIAAARLSQDVGLEYDRPLGDGRRLELTLGVHHFLMERGELQEGFWISLAAGLLLVLLVSLFATRLALAPLRGATRVMAGMNLDRLAARVPMRGTRDDVDRHAETANRMLAHVERGVARVRAFSLDVAHELRTPVNRIVNAAEVALLEEEPGVGARPALEMIRSSAEQMSAVIEGLLLLARQAEGRLELKREDVDFEALAVGLRDLYGAAFEERSVALALRVAREPVRGDRALLARAVANLLDNALAVSPAGGTVRLETSREGGRMAIRVTDTGPGVPEEARERIFDRFVRLTAARDGRGTGLGLPIARMVARAHGGDLTVASSPSGGALFTLWLPVEEPAPSDGSLDESEQTRRP